MDHTVRNRGFQCSYMKPNENSKERGKSTGSYMGIRKLKEKCSQEEIV